MGSSQINKETLLQDSMSSTQATAESFKKGLQNTIEQITAGFQVTMYMYTAVFLVGLILVCLSVYLSISTEKELVAISFGGMGLASMLAFFFSKTPIELQKSRAGLAQLQAAIFSWFVDITNWNSLLLQKGESLDFELMQKVSEAQAKTTKETIGLIGKNVGQTNV